MIGRLEWDGLPCSRHKGYVQAQSESRSTETSHHSILAGWMDYFQHLVYTPDRDHIGNRSGLKSDPFTDLLESFLIKNTSDAYAGAFVWLITNE